MMKRREYLKNVESVWKAPTILDKTYENTGRFTPFEMIMQSFVLDKSMCCSSSFDGV